MSDLSNLSSQTWRVLNLYTIVNKSGQKIPFVPNWAQSDLLANRWHRNCILKARQLGMSTAIGIYTLDTSLFNENTACGIVCDTLDNAKGLLKRISKTYKAMPAAIRKAVPTITDSATEMVFANGSSIKVGTSLRSSTVQILHISELGPTSVKFPDKAREIMTGALNTVSKDGLIFVESTAEGRSGIFYDLCKQAQALEDSNSELSHVDWRFHFYPWHEHDEYVLDSSISVDSETEEYFDALKSEHGIELTISQRNWYARMKITQQEHMKREYPSTPEEAFEQGSEGLYYNKLITRARQDKRICAVPHDYNTEVYTAWDLGSSISAIWFAQICGREIHLIDYIEGQGEGLPYYARVIKQRQEKHMYQYRTHFAPHDMAVKEFGTGEVRLQTAANLGINFKVLKRLGIEEGIEQTRSMLRNVWIDEKKCHLGIKRLEEYKMVWDNKNGLFKNEAVGDESSHGSDALRYMAMGLGLYARGAGGKEFAERLKQARREKIAL